MFHLLSARSLPSSEPKMENRMELDKREARGWNADHNSLNMLYASTTQVYHHKRD
jgi:hypothetical protein